MSGDPTAHSLGGRRRTRSRGAVEGALIALSGLVLIVMGGGFLVLEFAYLFETPPFWLPHGIGTALVIMGALAMMLGAAHVLRAFARRAA